LKLDFPRILHWFDNVDSPLAGAREAGAIAARGLAALRAALRSSIDAVDRRVADLVPTHPGGALFGLCLAPVRSWSVVWLGLRDAPRRK
jgi:hypothetical protein